MPRKIKEKTRKYRIHKKNKTKRSTKHGGRRKQKSRKWSIKYKKSINCKRPKGFSQRQYCKYGRKQKGGMSENQPNPGGEYNMDNITEERKQEVLQLIRNTNDHRNLDQLKTIISDNVEWEDNNYFPKIVRINEIGRKALKKMYKLQNRLFDETPVQYWEGPIADEHRLYEELQEQVYANRSF